MDCLYNEFILQRVLVQRTGASTEKLIAVAHELLDNLLLLIANRAAGGGDRNSVVWIVCFSAPSSSPFRFTCVLSILVFLLFMPYGAVHSEPKINQW